MFNSRKKSKFGKKSDDKRPKSSIWEDIMFLDKIQETIKRYNAYCEAQRRFYEDIQIIAEVKIDDISKENEKAID